MSSPTAIAAVTATLSRLMTAHVVVNEVTTLPPDRARGNRTETQLNIYLYQVAPNASRRNDFSSVKPAGALGDTSHLVAPVALNLHYLLTAYGPGETDEWESQRILGEAIRVLNDQPLLDGDRIRDLVTSNVLPDTGLDKQPERIRFSPCALSLDDAYKLFSSFNTPYRLSAAYEASMVLIDSQLQQSRPRPVLRRGPLDQGPVIDAGMPPRLDSVRFPVRPESGLAPAAAQISQARGSGTEWIHLQGVNLSFDAMTVQFRDIRGHGLIERPAFTTRGGLQVPLTSQRPLDDFKPPAGEREIAWWPEGTKDTANWHPGFYAVTVAVTQRTSQDVMRAAEDPHLHRDSNKTETGRAHRVRMRSNAIVISVAPKLISAEILPVANDPDHMELTCRVEPPVVAGQNVLLIYGHRSVAIVARDDTETLIALIPPDGLKKGTTVPVRLRVDEIENLSLAAVTIGGRGDQQRTVAESLDVQAIVR
jgi:hypothetical protein